MTITARKRFDQVVRSTMFAGLALAGLWSAACTDDLALDGEAAGGGRRLEVAVQSQAELARMEAYVADRYDPAAVVHTFEQPSGDIIDCVPRDQQPSLRGAAARGGVIATPPPSPPSSAGAPALPEGTEAILIPGRTDARGAERSCPEGTVPIRRVTLDDLTRFESLDDAMYMHPPVETEQEAAALRVGSSAFFQSAIVRHSGVPNQGVHTKMNLWSPAVEVSSEYSLSRAVVARGVQRIVAGWQTYPDLYGTSQPHFFIYSTSDGNGPASCYNHACGRFVQVDGRVAVGGAITPLSVPGGSQFEIGITLLLYQGNWWVRFNDIWVGYYPGRLFNAEGLAGGADYLDFGGAIIDDRSRHPNRHTTTDMGSGLFSRAGGTHAAYQRDLYYFLDPSTTQHLTTLGTSLHTSSTDPSCYDVTFEESEDPILRSYLYMGGPGYNADCL